MDFAALTIFGPDGFFVVVVVLLTVDFSIVLQDGCQVELSPASFSSLEIKDP